MAVQRDSMNWLEVARIDIVNLRYVTGDNIVFLNLEVDINYLVACTS